MSMPWPLSVTVMTISSPCRAKVISILGGKGTPPSDKPNPWRRLFSTSGCSVHLGSSFSCSDLGTLVSSSTSWLNRQLMMSA